MRVFKRQRKQNGQTCASKCWYAEVKDHRGIIRRLPGFTDRKQTEEFGRRLIRLIGIRILNDTPPPELAVWIEHLPAGTRDRLAKFDILDNRTTSGSKPLAEHLADWHRSILNAGRTSNHAYLQRARVWHILDDCRFMFYSDIDAARVQDYLADCRSGVKQDMSVWTSSSHGAARAAKQSLRKKKKKKKKKKEEEEEEMMKKKKKMSARTSNGHLQAIKQFCRWMVKERRASSSPVAHLSGLNIKTDRRRERRNLTGDELVRLIETTAAGPVREKLTGTARAVLYRLAAETGLRRKELASLTTDSFDFERLTVFASGGETKNHQDAELPLRAETAAMVERFIQTAGIASESPLWPNLTKRTAEMFKADLADAGIPYVDESGRVADFHSLRHSFISMLAAGGVHPKLAQTLARHSNINLTLSRYTHTVLSDESDALSALPSLPSPFDGPRQDRQTMRATGTDDVQSGGSKNGPENGPELHPFPLNSIHCHAQTVADGSPGTAAIEPIKQGVPQIKAEREGFEPSVQVSPHTGLAIRCPDSPIASKTNRLRNIGQGGGPENGPEPLIDDPDLLEIIEAWPSLPVDVRAEMVRIVKSAT